MQNMMIDSRVAEIQTLLHNIPKSGNGHLWKMTMAGEVADRTGMLKAFAVKDLLESDPSVRESFYEEYGGVPRDGQWGVFTTRDRLLNIVAELELDDLAEFFGY